MGSGRFIFILCFFLVLASKYSLATYYGLPCEEDKCQVQTLTETVEVQAEKTVFTTNILIWINQLDNGSRYFPIRIASEEKGAEYESTGIIIRLCPEKGRGTHVLFVDQDFTQCQTYRNFTMTKGVNADFSIPFSWFESNGSSVSVFINYNVSNNGFIQKTGELTPSRYILLGSSCVLCQDQTSTVKWVYLPEGYYFTKTPNGYIDEQVQFTYQYGHGKEIFGGFFHFESQNEIDRIANERDWKNQLIGASIAIFVGIVGWILNLVKKEIEKKLKERAVSLKKRRPNHKH